MVLQAAGAEVEDFALGSRGDEGLARRLKALACTAPLHDLDARKSQLQWADAAVYQMAEIGFQAMSERCAPSWSCSMAVVPTPTIVGGTIARRADTAQWSRRDRVTGVRACGAERLAVAMSLILHIA